MATYTSNINLKKPAQSDKIRIADFNGNADNIDAAIGADFGQGTKPSINQAINSLADGLAIIANGNVHAAITAGQFVYVRNHDTLSEGLYVASSNISANGTLSGSNLTADESGGLNALNSNIPKIISGSENAVVNNNGDIAAKALSPSGLGGITADNFQVVIMPTSDTAGTKAGHFWATKSTGQFTVYFRNNTFGNMTPGATVPFDYIVRVK